MIHLKTDTLRISNFIPMLFLVNMTLLYQFFWGKCRWFFGKITSRPIHQALGEDAIPWLPQGRPWRSSPQNPPWALRPTLVLHLLFEVLSTVPGDTGKPTFFWTLQVYKLQK